MERPSWRLSFGQGLRTRLGRVVEGHPLLGDSTSGTYKQEHSTEKGHPTREWVEVEKTD